MTHIRYLLATSDNEIGEIGPSPKGCGENRAILRCRPSLGMAKAFVLRLVRHDFRSQRRHSYMSIRPRLHAINKDLSYGSRSLRIALLPIITPISVK